MAGLYLHIPFCEKKCSYCDFYSIESTPLMDRFVHTLLRETEIRRDHDVGPITTVFFGGGTPSLLLPSHLDRIHSALHATWHIADDAEITMECNPGTVNVEKLSAYRSLGVNRCSFGVQSFHANELHFLDRIHSADDARAAVRDARAAGFTNINIDLMFALPMQTMASLDATLTEAFALEPDHISAYSLIYEHGTPLYARLQKGLVTPLSEDLDAAMYAHVMQRCADAGYQQYEVSNFARPDHRCAHNLLYWHAQPYIALGPSAHGYVAGERYWNLRSLTAWTQAVDAGTAPEANREALGSHERMFERAFLGLRSDGLDLAAFANETGIDLRAALSSRLSMWTSEGLVRVTNDVVQCTAAGYQVCDELTVHVVHAIERAAGVTWAEVSPSDPEDDA